MHVALEYAVPHLGLTSELMYGGLGKVRGGTQGLLMVPPCLPCLPCFALGLGHARILPPQTPDLTSRPHQSCGACVPLAAGG